MCKAQKYLQSTKVIVKTLLDVNESLTKGQSDSVEVNERVKQELQLFEHQLERHITSVEILEHRVQATLGLVSVVSRERETRKQQVIY